MIDKPKVANLIDTQISKYFPKKWTKKEIGEFIKYSNHIDTTSLNQNLNIPIAQFIKSGGKRIRPTLFSDVLNVFDKKYSNYKELGFVIELAHNATLMLDDIEDQSQTRRNQLTTYKKFGLDTAVNTGMTMHLMPLKIIKTLKNKLTANAYEKIQKIYLEEMLNVSFGQALDIYWHKNPATKISKNHYLEMSKLKTGSLMRMSVRFATAIAKQNNRVETIFSNFAESIGIAFQIKDDILDLESSGGGKFGKAYGNDITEGKISLPVVITLGIANKKDKSNLINILQSHTKNKTKIHKAISIINNYNSIQKSNTIAKKIVAKSLNILNQNTKNTASIEKLKEMADFFIERKN